MSRILSAEHRAVQKLARDFVQNEVKPRRLEADEGPEFLKEMVGRAGRLGLFRTVAPTEIGGKNLGRLGGVLVMEQVARECPGLGLSTLIQMTFPLVLASCPEASDRWLQSVFDGKTFLAGAYSDSAGIANYAEQPIIAKRDGADFILNCQRNYITQGTFANVYGVGGLFEDDLWCFWVSADTPGITIETQPKMGVGAPWGAITLSDVRIPASLASNLSFAVKDRTIVNVDGEGASSTLNISAWAVGLATGVHEKTIEFLKSRTASGRPIASMQAIQHRLAQQRQNIEAARSMVYDAAKARDEGQGDSTLDHLTKTFTTEMAADVARECVTMHGARGYLKEAGIEIYAREAIGGLIGECSNDMHYSTVAYLMGLPDAALGAF